MLQAEHPEFDDQQVDAEVDRRQIKRRVDDAGCSSHAVGKRKMPESSFGALVEVLRALQRLDIPHMLVGAHLSNAYGYPRSNDDADSAAHAC